MSVKRYLVDISSPVCDGGILKEVVLAADYDALVEVVRELIDSGNHMESFLPSTGLQLHAKANWYQEKNRLLALIGEKGV